MNMEMLTQLRQEKIIAIMRGLTPQEALQTAQALANGGIHFTEVTFAQDSPTCIEDTAASIEAITRALPDCYVGAGTVVTQEQLNAAYKAGAKYIISPNTDETIIKETVALGLVSMPGAFSPSEILNAYNWGARFVKLFPAGNLGVEYIKAIRAPISHVPILAVGGVKRENMAEFYQAGVCGFGIGANIIKKELIRVGDYDGITKLARAYADVAAAL